jgi:hypothetical protein
MKDKGKRITVRLEKHVIVLVTREVKRGLAVNKAQKAEAFFGIAILFEARQVLQ